MQDLVRSCHVDGLRIESERKAAGGLVVLARQAAALLAVSVRRELALEEPHIVAVQPAERADREELLDHGVVAGHGSS